MGLYAHPSLSRRHEASVRPWAYTEALLWVPAGYAAARRIAASMALWMRPPPGRTSNQ